MRKRSLSVIIALFFVLCLCLVGCSEKKESEKYFVNFSSNGQFSSVTEKFVLSDPDTSVFSYDVENDIFITIRPVINNYVSDGFIYLYGMVSAREGVLVSPLYTDIISINGDYAIVTKPAFIASENKYAQTIGVVKFRGENKGDLTDFMTIYNTGFSQYYFVGDYIACPGNKELPFSSFPYTTFYDYSTGKMLEVFKVRCDCTYEISIFDDYLVAVGDDHAFFYDTKDIQSDGYLAYDKRGGYLAYPEDTEAEYSDKIDVNIYYVGNGWFSRTARLKSTEEFVGYNIIYEETDTSSGASITYYANIRCDFYNAKERSTTDRQGLIVDNVANAYYTDYYSQFASYLNNAVTFDESTGEYDYHLPYMDMSAIIKDGFSIVYYYYFPYIESGSYQSEVTFCIMDKNANIISLDGMLMPTVYVDGVGTETSDPFYEEYYGSVHYFDGNLNRKEQVALETGKNTYTTYLYHGKGTVAGKINYEDISVKYGIVDTDGKIFVPFEYDELAPFYGQYTMGSKTEGVKSWYRISADGEITQVYDAVNVRQGVYVYQQFGKLGLKNYAGEVLLEAEYDSLDVYELFLTGGTFQTDYVIAVKDGVTRIFELQ